MDLKTKPGGTTSAAGEAPPGDRVELAAILTGGRARRMGQDKTTLSLGEIPMVERVYRRVRPLAQRVVTVGGPERLAPFGVPGVPDRYPGADAMGGIATALWYAGREFGPGAWVLCTACDLPLLRESLLRLLLDRRRDAQVVVPEHAAGREPLCALYRVSCLPAFEAEIARGNLRILDVYHQVQTRLVAEAELRQADPDLRSFLNVNRPEDLARARELIGEEPDRGPAG